TAQRGITTWQLALGVAAAGGLFGAFILLRPLQGEALVAGDNVIQGLLECVAFLLAVSGLAGRRPRAWLGSQCLPALLLACGILSYVAGQTLWTLNEDVWRLKVLFPTWADAGYLGSFPCVFLGILLLPSRPLARLIHARIVLDGLMIMTIPVALTWYFILGPQMLESDNDPLTKVISAAYPLATLMLVVCSLLLVVRANEPAIRATVVVLLAGLAAIIVTDTVYAYRQLHDAYSTGTLLDVGWPVGYLLVGLGARTAALAHSPPSSRNRFVPSPPLAVAAMPAVVGSALPYAVIAAVLAMLAAVWTNPFDNALEPGIYLAAGGLVLVMVVRQALAMREVHTIQAYSESLATAAEARADAAHVRMRERERIAMELHDGVIQSIYGVVLLLGARRRATSAAAPAQLDEAIQQLNDCIEDLRGYILELMTDSRAEPALADQLAALVGGIRLQTPALIRLELNALHSEPADTDAHNVLQIVREAISNALRHAQSDSVSVRLRQRGNFVHLVVADDGRGFQPGRVRHIGDGLHNMAERARTSSARLTVRSRVGAGTLVCLSLPVAGHAALPGLSSAAGASRARR
ncbi:MAG TPA: ATP-binding protein, partial [Chloroflexota bacterium]|nr:ATP-binding protein [Chloroflexota bacterium]